MTLTKKALLLLPGLCAGLLTAFSSARADAVGAEVLLLTAHVASETIDLGRQYQRRLSSDGRFVITPGLEVYFDRDLGDAPLGLDVLRLSLAGYLDSVDHLAGYAAILPRWEFTLKKKLRLSFGVGPTLIFREDWNSVPGYRDDGFYNTSDRFLPGYQYKLIIGGDLDVQYQLTPRLQGVWSIVPGIPYVITQSLGLRWGF